MDATVVIPSTGHRLALLERALRSVRDQTWAPREIVVVVDAGPEVMLDVVRVAGAAVRVVATGASGGVSCARNLGAECATTSFLAFLDDDDRWKPEYLERVFADGDDFDVTLTAFEKHGARGVWPEKVPPATLTPDAFLVGNPGLRGSNLVVRKETYASIGGFDVGLPTFNDMDFGLRLSLVTGVRYRRVTAHLVEYHTDDGDRLTGTRSPQVRPGLEAYLMRHGARMTPQQEAAFRDRARRFWGEDPWRAEVLRRRLACSMGPSQASAVAHAAQTRHQQIAGQDDREAASLWEIAREAARLDRPGLSAVRFVVITTDTPGTFGGWLASLATALADAGWLGNAGGPRVEVLRIANDASRGIDEVNRRVDPDGLVVHTAEVPAHLRPLPLAFARPFAFVEAARLGWRASAATPIWFLDEDFRFEVLVPSREHGFVRRSGGPLLHRLAAMARDFAREDVDAIVGGNSGAAPVPSLGTVLRQVLDLCEPVADDGDWVARYAAVDDPYYDFGSPGGRDLRVPFKCAWWRSDYQVSRDEITRRLQSGLPVTRPALANPLTDVASAWAERGPARVAGGNVVMLTSRAMDATLFAHATCGEVLSRRADTLWCLRAGGRGAKVVRGCLPLVHERAVRTRTGESAAHEARADALGVGLYRSLVDGRVDPGQVLVAANLRLSEQRASIARAIDLLWRASHAEVVLDRHELVRWLEAAHAALAPLTAPITVHMGGEA